MSHWVWVTRYVIKLKYVNSVGCSDVINKNVFQLNIKCQFVALVVYNY